MNCPHNDFSVCDSCWARQKADDRLVALQDLHARERQREWQRERADRQAAAAAGPGWLDAYATRVAAQGQARQAAKAAARGGQPFSMFWYERVACVGAAGLFCLMLLNALPPWLLLVLVVSCVGLGLRHGPGPLRPAGRAVAAFVRGRSRAA